MNKRTTLKDIAEKAGVTTATVSMALRDDSRGRISDKTRRKIRRIAKRLNYRPNYIAKSLVSKKSHSIGLIITTLQNPFYAELSHDVLERAITHGYSVHICSVADNLMSEQKAVDELLMRGVDGLIICSTQRNSDAVHQLVHQSTPFVLAMRSIDQGPEIPKVDYIGLNNFLGAHLAVEHLIKLGHKRIGMICGPEETSTGHDRRLGAESALKAYQIQTRDEFWQSGDFSRSSGHDAAKQLLAVSDAPTAIFAGNDYMAIGVLDFLANNDMRAPDDIAVVGFDDIEMAGLPGVDLTTVSQKKSIMGRMAVDRLIEKIEDKTFEVTTSIILEPLLVVRRTCGG